MKNLILVAALSVTLVACDQAAEESDEPTAEATAATEAAAATASTTPGTYEYEYDGKQLFGISGPGVIPENIDPKHSGESTEQENGDHPGNKQAGDSEQHCVQISLFHRFSSN